MPAAEVRERCELESATSHSPLRSAPSRLAVSSSITAAPAGLQSPQTTLTSIDRWLRTYRARTWSLRVTVTAHPYVVHYMQRHRGAAFWKWLRQYFMWVTYKEDDNMEAGEFQCHTPGGKDITSQYQ